MRILLIFLIINAISAKAYQSGIDTVYSFSKGSGQNAGQSPEYYPQNIFGLPDKRAKEQIPSSDPAEILSLGLEGEIVVGFKDYVVIDGEGPDFTIFENAFINPVTKKLFVEPAIVSVSENGLDFVEFPYDSETLQGCAGITPTIGASDPFDAENSGGDKFDLADVGINRVKYIKIKDFTKYLLDNPGHEYYDPIVSGFDLDAVIGLNLYPDKPAIVEKSEHRNIRYKFTRGILSISVAGFCSYSLSIYNSIGSFVYSREFSTRIDADISGLSRGAYIAVVKNGESSESYKFIKY